MTPASLTDAAYQTLAAVRMGREFVYDDVTGRMVVVLRPGEGCEIGDELDELIARGWVTADGERITVSSAGCYHLERWMRKTGMELNTEAR